MSIFLGIETSCDECSISVVERRSKNNFFVLGIATSSQEKIHQPYGGIVPEIASRSHLETVLPTLVEAVKQAQLSLEKVDAIAVTQRPGLIGSLLVGVTAAKALGYAYKKPLIAVHHLEGHIASLFLQQRQWDDFPLPMLIAVVSGGHTHLHYMPFLPDQWPIDFLKTSLIGRSRDDAAGEAFDKIGKLLGFPYPGGCWVDQTAKNGNPKAFSLPRALSQVDTYDFSFSGLKTAVSLLVNRLQKEGSFEDHIPDICASAQAAIIDVLWSKISLGILKLKCQSLGVVGGVIANSYLRKKLECDWESLFLKCPPFIPPLAYCTDNAAMIAVAGAFRFEQGFFLRPDEYLSLNALAHS